MGKDKLIFFRNRMLTDTNNNISQNGNDNIQDLNNDNTRN